MAILYIAAEQMELQPFVERLHDGRKLHLPLDFAYEGTVANKRILLVANGAGPRLASAAARLVMESLSVAKTSSAGLEAVVSTGFCGALDPGLRPNNIVIGDTVVSGGGGSMHDCALPVFLPAPVTTGAVVSQDRVANCAAEKARLRAHGALAVEMEAAGVFAQFQRTGIPCFCIKIVTDAADESFSLDLNQMRSPEGRILRGKIVRSALIRPHLWPELLRLKKRAEIAAEALGDFLVSCRVLPDGTDIVTG